MDFACEIDNTDIELVEGTQLVQLFQTDLKKCRNECKEGGKTPHYLMILDILESNKAGVSSNIIDQCKYILAGYFVVTAMHGGFRNYTTEQVNRTVPLFGRLHEAHKMCILEEPVRAYLEAVKNQSDRIIALLLGFTKTDSPLSDSLVAFDDDPVVSVRTARLLDTNEAKARGRYLASKAEVDDIVFDRFFSDWASSVEPINWYKAKNY